MFPSQEAVNAVTTAPAMAAFVPAKGSARKRKPPPVPACKVQVPVAIIKAGELQLDKMIAELKN